MKINVRRPIPMKGIDHGLPVSIISGVKSNKIKPAIPKWYRRPFNY